MKWSQAVRDAVVVRTHLSIRERSKHHLSIETTLKTATRQKKEGTSHSMLGRGKSRGTEPGKRVLPWFQTEWLPVCGFTFQTGLQLVRKWQSLAPKLEPDPGFCSTYPIFVPNSGWMSRDGAFTKNSDANSERKIFRREKIPENASFPYSRRELNGN